MNKRDFLKGLILFFPAGGVLGALAGELGAKEAAPAQTGTAGAAPKPGANAYDPKSHYYGMGVEIDKCIGCNRCVEACKAENDVLREPFFFRTWIERYVIKKDGDVVVESISVKSKASKEASQDDADVLRTFFVPKLCNHCVHPPCVQVCPVGATFATEDGVVLIDSERCIGCRYCIQACPGAPGAAARLRRGLPDPGAHLR
jgi:Fe-S-cluster-containing hydrogenase component 2